MTDVNEIELSEELSISEEDVNAFLAHFGVRGMHWGVVRDRGSSGRVEGESKPAKAPKSRVGKLTVNGTEYRKFSKADQQKHDAIVRRKAVGITYGTIGAVFLANDKYARYYMKQGAKALADPKRWAGTATLAHIAVKNLMARRGGKAVVDKGLKAIGTMSVYALRKGSDGTWG